MGFVNFVDWVSQLAATPVFHTVHGAVSCSNRRSITLNHTRDLLALIRVDQKHDFVVTHCISSWI